MKYLFIIIVTILLSSGKAYSEEKINCNNFKKFSIQYTWCKSKNLGSAVKNKVGNFKKNKILKKDK